ncbi:MAG: hypothetical protein ACPLZ9_07045 [Candidatus Ratteibacteria bacterium]
MSKKLLEFLNGGKKGYFRKFLDSRENINIAWYPSAGKDFRSICYLSREYAEVDPPSIEVDVFPDLFIYTDYHPYFDIKIIHKEGIKEVLFREINVREIEELISQNVPIEIHNDGRTRVTLEKIEELPSLDLPLDPEIVDSPEAETGRVLFLEIKLVTTLLNEPIELVRPVIYAFVENESFCSRILLPNKSEISHIIHVVYGSGFGGARGSGGWLLNVLKKLNCRIYITDGIHELREADKAAMRKYPNLRGELPKMVVIKAVRRHIDRTYIIWCLIP